MQAARLTSGFSIRHISGARFDAGWSCGEGCGDFAPFADPYAGHVRLQSAGFCVQGLALRDPFGGSAPVTPAKVRHPRPTRKGTLARRHRRRRRSRVYAVDGSGRRVKTQVMVTTLSLADVYRTTGGRPKDALGRLVAAATDEVLPFAWQDWTTAADWAYRTPDLRGLRRVLDRMLITCVLDAEGPVRDRWAKAFRAGLDVALGTLEFFTRLRTPDGGVRGGVMHDPNPGFFAGILLKAQTYYAYAPDVWSTWEYAATAAQMSRVLAVHDGAAAALWLARATQAMDWAEARVLPQMDTAHLTARNLAAAQLFAATRDARWHQLFVQTSCYSAAASRPAWDGYQYEAAATYCDLDAAVTDPALVCRARATLSQQGELDWPSMMQGPNMVLPDPTYVNLPARAGGKAVAAGPSVGVDGALFHGADAVGLPRHLQWRAQGLDLCEVGALARIWQALRAKQAVGRKRRAETLWQAPLADQRRMRLIGSGFAEVFVTDPAADVFVGLPRTAAKGRLPRVSES